MPYSDSKNVYCKPFNLIEIWDVDGSGADRYVGLFRIMPKVEDSLGIDANIKYTLEHVATTLLDDVMLGWHEIGNTGTNTSQVINYIFNKQTIKRWVLGDCNYAHEYLYGWQDENLLSALYSVVTPFSENDFYWDFDTRSYPWRMSLRKTKNIPIVDIRYRKNLDGIIRTEDPSNLTTRLYCYGYGDGDNKLNIKSVNNGVPYLESPNISKYGVLTQVWTDPRISVEDTLKTTGIAMLEKLDKPIVTYDISMQTILEAGNLAIGDTVRIVHGLLDETKIVQEFSKDDVSGAPKSGKVLLGTGTNDFGNSIADLAERQRISETYSQGSESIFMDSFYDNADNANPAETTFTIPENAVHINEIRFNAKLTNFRAYSKATLGGGAATPTSTDGGSASPTSASGGGGSVTSVSGGGGSLTSASGGGASVTSLNSSLPESTYRFLTSSLTAVGSSVTGSAGSHSGDGWAAGAGVVPTSSANGPGAHTHTGGSHAHSVSFSVPSHQHSYSVQSHDHIVSNALPSHSHQVDIPNHQHIVNLQDHNHSVVIPSHTHQVVIPSHTHQVTIPNHTHAIEYGIYKGPIASQMAVYLDDVLIGTYSSSVRDLNLISYMSKNANGEVMRGSHTIKIVPSSLTRIECSFQIRMFTNARGSGQY